jgi:inversin
MSDYINWRDRRGWTPLHIAVCRDDARIAEYLLRFGANLLLPLSHNSSPCRDTPAHVL